MSDKNETMTIRSPKTTTMTNKKMMKKNTGASGGVSDSA